MLRQNPIDRINHGFSEVESGIKDLREDYERVAIEQERRRAALGTAEGKSRSLTLDAIVARRPRHLQPGETTGRRRPDRDGPRAPSMSGDLVGPTAVDERTRRSLELMCLGLRPKPAQ